MERIREWIYQMGYRPKIGSIFYSPKQALHYDHLDNSTIEWLRMMKRMQDKGI